jgi:hypothetical protein
MWNVPPNKSRMGILSVGHESFAEMDQSLPILDYKTNLNYISNPGKTSPKIHK